MPWNLRMSPFILASSGRPFNITTGLDTNGDSIFTERPTYAVLSNKCQQLKFDQFVLRHQRYFQSCYDDHSAQLRKWSFVVLPSIYSLIKPSDSANLPKDRSLQTRTDKPAAAVFPGSADAVDAAAVAAGRGGGGRGGFGGGGNERPYNLTVGLDFRNLFNTVNLANPIGNLNSSRFGQSVSTAGGFGGFRGGGGGSDSGNRRVELQLRFSF